MAIKKGPIQFKPQKQPQPETFDFPLGYAGGINISRTADLIAKNQSPDMCNMNYDNGVPGKRYGFSGIRELDKDKPLKGLFEIELTYGNVELLAFSNGKVWLVD